MRHFNTVWEAQNWMFETVDDPCVDNTRFAWVDDPAAVTEYRDNQNHGCCGFFDAEIVIDGRKAIIGCNYGH